MLATERMSQPGGFLEEQTTPILEAGTIWQSLTEDLHIPTFDPEIHLNFHTPAARYLITELGLEKPHNVPDTCYMEPFQLFPEEGVRVMRREIFRKETLDKCMRSWSRAPCYVGGFSSTEGVSMLTPPQGPTG